MIRVAAVGDVHFGRDSRGRMRDALERLPDDADLLVLAGDLTKCGGRDEAQVLADELRGTPVPMVAVLGNHDYHGGEADSVQGVLEHAGVCVLEGSATVVDIGDIRVGVAGSKGFGGGFAGACATEFGEPEMKAFVAHTREVAARFEDALDSLDTDVRVALLHYAPIDGTLTGERLEIYPFLGSYLLGEALDRATADLAVHGHAHNGTEKGATPGGVHVRNVAQPVIRHPYNVYLLPVRDRVQEPVANVTSPAL